MPNTTWPALVPALYDGQDVSKEVMDPILNTFTKRTQYLYEAFDEMADKSVLISFNELVAPSSSVAQYSVVYFDPSSNEGGLKLTKPAIEFQMNFSSVQATNSSYVLGIVKDEVPSSEMARVDVWLEGMINRAGLISELVDQASIDAEITTGPMFLSTLEPGKLTFIPGGLAIYVGFAKDANTLYLNPTFNSVNDFFLSYRFNLIDRPVSQPILTAGIWTIPGIVDKVGWVCADAVDSMFWPTWVNRDNSSTVFLYNVPTTNAAIDDDTGLTAAEKASAKELRRTLLSPGPTAFTFLTVNGVVQSPIEDTRLNGAYSVNSYGLWWAKNADPLQPWPSDLSAVNPFDPADWITDSWTYEDRKYITFMFVKVNPEYRAAVVTSLKPYNSTYTNSLGETIANDSTKAVQLVTDADGSSTADRGDLLVRFKLPVSSTAQEGTLSDPKTSTAVKSVSYSEPDGQLVVKTGPSISSIAGVGGVRATTDTGTGACTIEFAPYAIPNLVTSLEPENSRLEFLGLNSYLAFNYARLPCGLVGKFMLPSMLTGNGLKLNLIAFGMGSPESGKRSVDLVVEYSITGNSQVVVATKTAVTLSLVNPDGGANLTYYKFPTGYLAKTTVTVPLLNSSGVTIPASELLPGSLVSFRIQRPKPTETSAVYLSDFCIAGIYWTIG